MKNSIAKKTILSEYIFTFELLRHYPTVRSFIIKQPLKHSMRDSILELLAGKK